VENERDRRLLEKYGVRTVRLDNRRIMQAAGEAYVMEAVKTAVDGRG
jgi:hypothetical protein